MLAFDQKVDETETIAEACLDRYRALGIQAETIPWKTISLDNLDTSTDPVIKTDRRLDWIIGQETAPQRHAAVFGRLVAQGWAVHALVPMELLGETHRSLRGTPIRLQGWWIDEGGVHFGRPEIP